MIINKDQILSFDNLYRRNLVNSLLGFKPALLIGTIDNENNTNLAIFSQIFHVGATPPLIGILFRPDSVERHTLENIRETQVFTINSITKDTFKKAHQTSARYAKQESEFEMTGLTTDCKSGFKAPFVKESPLKIACSSNQEITLEVNGTILLIGNVEFIELPDQTVLGDGFIDHHAMNEICAVGLDSYYKPEPVDRLSYAKANKTLTSLPFKK
jgi:flavin reductase (DIM6/NTAB) family NADH-FMN oxidoreductase RutF